MRLTTWPVLKEYEWESGMMEDLRQICQGGQNIMIGMDEYEILGIRNIERLGVTVTGNIQFLLLLGVRCISRKRTHTDHEGRHDSGTDQMAYIGC